MAWYTKEENRFIDNLVAASKWDGNLRHYFIKIFRTGGPALTRRVLVYLRFLKENRHRLGLNYDHLVAAFVSAFTNQKVLREQDPYEVEQTLYFLDLSFSTLETAVFEDKKSCTTFVLLAVFYGKYSSLQVRSIDLVFSQLKPIIGNKQVREALKQLFCKNPEKLFVADFFGEIEYTAWDYLAYCCQGNPPENYESLPLKVSTNNVQRLQNYNYLKILQAVLDDEKFSRYSLSSDFQRKDRYFERPILRSMVMATIADTSNNLALVIEFFKHNDSFLNYFDRFYECELRYWLAAFRLISTAIGSSNEFEELKELIPYLSTRLNRGKSSLTGISYEELLREKKKSKTASVFSNDGKNNFQSWELGQKQEWTVNIKHIDYRIIELGNSRELEEEGEFFGFDVLSYQASCVKGEARVFSLQGKKEGEKVFQRNCTIEVVKDRIVQRSGEKTHNFLPSVEEVVALWSEESGWKMKEGYYL